MRLASLAVATAALMATIPEASAQRLRDSRGRFATAANAQGRPSSRGGLPVGITNTSPTTQQSGGSALTHSHRNDPAWPGPSAPSPPWNAGYQKHILRPEGRLCQDHRMTASMPLAQLTQTQYDEGVVSGGMRASVVINGSVY